MSNEEPKKENDTSGSSVTALADTMSSDARPGFAKDGATTSRIAPVTRAGTTTDIIGAVLNDRYTVTKKIGQGGMGAVYEATHNLIGKRVALKILLDKHANNEQVVARLKLEARLASSIGHQNIIDITDFGATSDGRTFVVMEYLDGESLGARIARDGRLDSVQTLHIAKQVAGALAAAHDKGIVHRDIKPENIFIVPKDNEDYVKVLDFGISKSMTDQEDDLRLTQTGMVLGTPLYMSPEQARGDEDLDHRIDIYALGVLLYETLTGEVPFKGKNYLSILTQVTSETPIAPRELVPDIDRDLESITMKAMAKERSDRYLDMHEFAADLEALTGPGLNTTSGRIVAARWRRKKERSSIGVYAVGIGVSLAIAGASVWGVSALMANEEGNRAGSDAAVALAVVELDAAPAPPVIAEPARVTVKIVSHPDGVSIFHDEGQKCERTPCELEFLQQSAEVVLRGSLDGYDDGIMRVSPAIDAGKTLTITLKKKVVSGKGRVRPKRGIKTTKQPKDAQKLKQSAEDSEGTTLQNGSGELKVNPFGKAPK